MKKNNDVLMFIFFYKRKTVDNDLENAIFLVKQFLKIYFGVWFPNRRNFLVFKKKVFWYLFCIYFEQLIKK